MTKPIDSVSPLRLVKWCTQWQPMKNWREVPRKLRGIYVLHKQEHENFNVVYVGMAASGTGIRRRLRSHASRKKSKWTHFSMFVVWENIRNDEITELESLFRAIYSRDALANSLNKQKRSKNLREVTKKSPTKWVQP